MAERETFDPERNAPDKGSRLLPQELVAIADTARAARLLRRSIHRLPEVNQRFPQFLDLSSGLIDAMELETTIGRTIGPAGEVLDSASPALSRIRKEVRIAHGRLMDRLNRFVGSANPASAGRNCHLARWHGTWCRFVRIVAGRFPAWCTMSRRADRRYSSSRLEVVELNNRWREAQIEETREVDRILDELSHETGRYASELRLTVDSVARIDFAMAKARLAFSMRATQPNDLEPGSSRRLTLLDTPLSEFGCAGRGTRCSIRKPWFQSMSIWARTSGSC